LENEFVLPLGRFSVFEGIKNSKIFDSSYNSSLDASVGAIKVLSSIAVKERKIGIFGNINELGSISRLQHELLAKEIVRELDFAVIIGDQMLEYVEPVLKENNFKYLAFETYNDAKVVIPEIIQKNDFILIKASQNGMFFERIVEDLLSDKMDVEKLCRRGRYWDNIRRKSR